MKWLEVEVETEPENKEKIIGIFSKIGINKLTIIDPKDIMDIIDSQDKGDWDFIDESLLKIDKSKVFIKAYISEAEDIEKIKLYLLETIEKEPYLREGYKLGNISFKYIEDRDWSEAWKRYYKPIRVGENIVVKPTWEKYNSKAEDIIIEIDPGMAFGTGDHETTYMCLEALEEYINESNLVYDIGCGSGILSIASKKLGADRVIGVDIDRTSVETAKENIKINNLDGISILHGDLLTVIEGKADLVVSNIIAEIIIDVIEDIDEYLKLDGIFIGSGIINNKLDLVLDKLKEKDLTILEIKKMGEWACVVAQR